MANENKQSLKQYCHLNQKNWALVKIPSPFNDQCSHLIETSHQLICRTNQLTDFYMMVTLVVKKLR